MSRAEDPARDRLNRRVLSARGLPGVLVAKEALRQWMQDHPDDQGMRAGFEQLFLIREIEEWKLANLEDWQAQQEAERRTIAAHAPK